MLRALRQRLGVLLVVALWGMPAASAMVLSLHVALDHHHHSEESHHATADLLAAAHGHRHPEVVPDHEHSATSAEAAVVLRVVPADAPLGTLANLEARTPDTLRPLDSHADPPERLFYTHCSLLL